MESSSTASQYWLPKRSIETEHDDHSSESNKKVKLEDVDVEDEDLIIKTEDQPVESPEVDIRVKDDPDALVINTEEQALSYLAGHESDELMAWKTKMLTRMCGRLKRLLTDFDKTGTLTWSWYGEGLLQNIRESAQLNFVGTRSQRLMKKTRVEKLLEMIVTRRKYRPICPDQLSRDLIKDLYRKWFIEKIFLGSTLEHDIIDDDDISDLDESGLADAPVDDNITHNSGIMRGIIIARNSLGATYYKIHPNCKVCEFRSYGHNNLTIGDWWPFQVCLKRDGAHGSHMGGISGTAANGGAYSIIVNGGYEEDEDDGDVIFYSGSGGKKDQAGKKLNKQVRTDANRALAQNIHSVRLVRVFRGSKAPGRLSPREGIRYDGLYRVIRERERVSRENFIYSCFELRRVSGQDPIDLSRPTADEVRELIRMTPHRN